MLLAVASSRSTEYFVHANPSSSFAAMLGVHCNATDTPQMASYIINKHIRFT